MCNLSRRSPCLVAGDNPARGRGLYAYGLIRVIHDLLICCAPGEGRAGLLALSGPLIMALIT